MRYEDILIQSILRSNAPRVLDILRESKEITVTQSVVECGFVKVPVTAEVKVLQDSGFGDFDVRIKVKTEPKSLSYHAIASNRDMSVSGATSKEIARSHELAAGYVEYLCEKIKVDLLRFVAEQAQERMIKLR
jgi:hypothetical protein